MGKRLGVEATSLLRDIAFGYLGATSVFAVIHPQHPASYRLVQELGFSEVSQERDGSGELAARVFELRRDGT
jgi:RimJ/RimL family protein N-acetyltransferase